MNITWPFRNKPNRITLPDQADDIDDSFDNLFQDMAAQAAAIGAYLVNLATDVAGLLPISRLLTTGNPTSSTFLSGTGAWTAAGETNRVPQPWLRRAVWIEAGPSASFGIGTTVNSANSANVPDSAHAWFDLSSAVSGTVCHVSHNNDSCWADHDPICIVRVKTGSDITSVRIWVGLTNGTNFTDVDTSAAHAIAFRYSTVAGDGGWVGVTRDTGVGQTVSGTVATIAASTEYVLRIDVSADGTSALFTVMNNAGAILGTQTITTNIKKGVGYKASATVVPKVNVVRHLFVSAEYVEAD